MRRAQIPVVRNGARGLLHVRTVAPQDRAALPWVCDRDAGALARGKALAPRARATHDIGELLRARDVDAIVIATPAVTHAELAVRCLEHHRHVLVEKPLALATSEAERVAV